MTVPELPLAVLCEVPVQIQTTEDTDDDTIVHWSAFKDPLGLGRGSNQYLVLDSVIRKAKRPREDACDFWEPYFLRSMLSKAPAGQ